MRLLKWWRTTEWRFEGWLWGRLMSRVKRNVAHLKEITGIDETQVGKVFRMDRLAASIQAIQHSECIEDIRTLRSGQTVEVHSLQRHVRSLALAMVHVGWETERALRIIGRQKRRIAMPPGRWIGWFARTFLTLKTQTGVVEPLMADYRYEVYEAIIGGQRFGERYLTVLYGLKFMQVTFGAWATALIRLLVSATK